MSNGYIVEETIEGAHFSIKNYPLIRGDLIMEEPDGTYFKEFPGIGIGGFTLTEEQKSRLRPVVFEGYGLNYHFPEIDWDAEYR